MHCITHIDLPVTTPATKAAHQPSFLRTYKLPVPKAAVVPKISQTLAEIGISYNRLVMPTEGNVARLNALVDATLPLVETKRVLDKVEYDIKVLKERLNMRNGAPADEDADGDGAIDAADGEAVEGMEDGRAQSVVSTRSTRSRKPVSHFKKLSPLPDVPPASLNVNIVGGYHWCRNISTTSEATKTKLTWTGNCIVVSCTTEDM